MTEFTIVCVVLALGIFLGVGGNQKTQLRKCVEYYSDMPHNKVTDHCKTLLKFEKPTK